MSHPPGKPWAKGPFELIRHADGHLRKEGDIDRRIALIGFDNAIEVCIDVFLNLNPKLRDGFTIEKERKKKYLNNYHSKVSFLDDYVEEKNIELSISIESIIWFHSLRNELYHSGNGMVPEMHVVRKARKASVAVFASLFGEDAAEPLFNEGSRDPVGSEEDVDNNDRSSAHVQEIPYVSGNGQMEFLRKYVNLENFLQSAVQKLEIVQDRNEKFKMEEKTMSGLWSLVLKSKIDIRSEWSDTIDKATHLRNRVVHGRSIETEEDEIVDLYVSLDEIEKDLKKRIR